MSPAHGRPDEPGLAGAGDALPEALVLLNPLAGGTRSRERWARESR